LVARNKKNWVSDWKRVSAAEWSLDGEGFPVPAPVKMAASEKQRFPKVLWRPVRGFLSALQKRDETRYKQLVTQLLEDGILRVMGNHALHTDLAASLAQQQAPVNNDNDDQLALAVAAEDLAQNMLQEEDDDWNEQKQDQLDLDYLIASAEQDDIEQELAEEAQEEQDGEWSPEEPARPRKRRKLEWNRVFVVFLVNPSGVIVFYAYVQCVHIETHRMQVVRCYHTTWKASVSMKHLTNMFGPYMFGLVDKLGDGW
jgi:hypothetical protein